MRAVALVVLVLTAAGCASGAGVPQTKETVMLSMCVSTSPSEQAPLAPYATLPDDRVCVDGYPSCRTWRHRHVGGKEVVRQVRDATAAETERICRAFGRAYEAENAPPRPLWSRGSAEEIGRALEG